MMASYANQESLAGGVLSKNNNNKNVLTGIFIFGLNFYRPLSAGPEQTRVEYLCCCRLQNSRFRSFRKARSALSVILECESREPHTPAGRVRRENDCRLFIQRIRSKRGSYNITEVTEIA